MSQKQLKQWRRLKVRRLEKLLGNALGWRAWLNSLRSASATEIAGHIDLMGLEVLRAVCRWADIDAVRLLSDG